MARKEYKRYSREFKQGKNAQDPHDRRFIACSFPKPVAAGSASGTSSMGKPAYCQAIE